MRASIKASYIKISTNFHFSLMILKHTTLSGTQWLFEAHIIAKLMSSNHF
jgi:hypothetical protein